MVGEGQTTRKGLLRFVLENEGFDVVAEATSTLELAQRLVIHHPDIVVLDDGIDASAVGMMREVVPAAKVVLVWPKGVTAVGADARLDPSEVMTALGSTVARVAGRGTVIAPPRPRLGTHDVVVLPEPESADVTDPDDVGSLPGVLLEPPRRAPSWTYASSPTSPIGERARAWMFAGAAIVVVLAAFALGRILPFERTVAIRSLSGSIGDVTLPGAGDGVTATTSEVPGTYEGVVRVRANGSIRIRAKGDIHLRISGAAHVVAQGNVTVRGDGVVNNVSATKVRVRGNGTIRIAVSDGHIRLRVEGSVTAHGEGTVRIGGQGMFLISHHPLG